MSTILQNSLHWYQCFLTCQATKWKWTLSCSTYREECNPWIKRKCCIENDWNFFLSKTIQRLKLFHNFFKSTFVLHMSIFEKAGESLAILHVQLYFTYQVALFIPFSCHSSKSQLSLVQSIEIWLAIETFSSWNHCSLISKSRLY